MLNPYVFFASDLKGLSGNKKGTKDPDDPLSRKVPLTGQLSNHFWEDLEEMYKLKSL